MVMWKEDKKGVVLLLLLVPHWEMWHPSQTSLTLQEILAIVLANNDKLLAVLCEKIYEKLKLRLTIGQLSAFLKDRGFVWKKVGPHRVVI
jgi:hypothetical protein